MSELAARFSPEDDIKFPPTLELVQSVSEIEDGAKSEYAPVELRTHLSHIALDKTTVLEEGTIHATDDNDVTEQLPAGLLSVDTMKDYLRNIGKVPLLDAAQEVELAKAIEAGLFAEKVISEGEKTPTEVRELYLIEQEGKRAFDTLVSANLRLVVSLSKRYFRSSMAQMDLIQEGTLGLIRAAEKFDYTKGFKFSTYATWWIRQAIERSIADQSRTIRIPVHTVEKINKIRNTRGILQAKLKRFPTDEEVAAELDMSLPKLRQFDADVRQNPTSLNVKLGEDGETERGDLIPDDRMESPEAAGDKLAMKMAIAKILDEIENGVTKTPEKAGNVIEEKDKLMIEVIRRRFGLIDGEPQSLVSIGEQLGMLRERTRNLESRFFKRVRENKRYMAILRDYL